MIRGSVFIGPHAVRRYVERCRPGLSYDAAREELLAAIADAHPIKSSGDCVVLRTGRAFGRIRLVVGPGRGPFPALLTVLSARTSKGRRRC